MCVCVCVTLGTQLEENTTFFFFTYNNMFIFLSHINNYQMHYITLYVQFLHHLLHIHRNNENSLSCELGEFHRSLHTVCVQLYLAF